MLVGVFLAGDARFSRAQATVDYDTDNDGLIEVSTRAQLQAIHYDLNTDGIPETRGAWRESPAAWATAFPNAMTGAGCPARDHDNNPATADEARCVGYELVNDITAGAWNPIGKMTRQAKGADFTGKLVGNGYRVINATQRNAALWIAFISAIGATGSVEGLGLVNPQFANTDQDHAGMAADLGGSIIGSYVEDGQIHIGRSGGLVGVVRTASDHAGLIAHSYARGVTVGDSGGRVRSGILAYTFSNQTGTNQARCLNSYSSGTIRSVANRPDLHGLIASVVGTGTQIDNCYGDTNSITTGGADKRAWGDATADENTAHTRSAAQLQAPTGYTGIYENWNDYAADGTELDATAPRTDFWYFGDSASWPMHKGWGHDRTLALARSATSVNLCTRTLTVANEIIRLLKDSTYAPGVTQAVPTAVTNLTQCTASTDTQTVSVANLRDYVATTPTVTFNISPDRTFPQGERLKSLDVNDFAYLTNARHFDLGGNDLETLPPRLFQGIPVRYLDLSNNKLTSLPADLFAGRMAVSDVGGNALLLNGNTLTDTGLPGRIFDPLTHLNGLDLSDNSLTRVNTRWFESLVNLGRKAATSPPYTHALGLHLAGNTLTEHHYSNKLFTGIKTNTATYVDTASPTATAGDALRTAIIAAITAKAGGTTPTTLSLSGTDYWYNAGGTTTGYQSSGTTCLSSQTQGPGRYDYVGGTAPECQIQPHWTPPHKATDSPTTAPSFSGSAVSTETIFMRLNHNPATYPANTFVAYQMRSRPSTADPWSPWQVPVITVTSGSKSIPYTVRDFGTTHNFELRALSTTGTPSGVATRDASTQAGNWVPSFSAAPGTTAFGTIALTWGAATGVPSGYSAVGYYYRYKLRSDTFYSAWKSGGTGTTATIWDLTRDAVYDVQLVAAIDDNDADTDPDFFTNRYSASTRAFSVPQNLGAVSGTAPGSIEVTWSQQALSLASTSRFRIRWKRKSASAWGDWTDVPDDSVNTDAGTNTHDETAFTINNLAGDDVEYDVQVAFFWNAAQGGWQDPVEVEAKATAIPAPSGLTATSSQTAGAIDLTWTAQSTHTGSTASYRVRYKYSDTTSWTSYMDLPDSTRDADTNAHNENGYTITGLNARRPVDIWLAFGVGGVVGSGSTLTNIRAGYQPRGLSAATGTAPGTIDLSWTEQMAHQVNTAVYQTRAKPATGNWPSDPNAVFPANPAGWRVVADSSDAGTFTYDEDSYQYTGLTAGELYDIMVTFAPDGITWTHLPSIEVVQARAAIVQIPTNFTATTSTTTVNAIDLTWDKQTASEEATSQHQYRIRQNGAAWPTTSTMGWTPIGDGSDTGSHTYDEEAFTVTGLTAGTQYDVELRFFWTATAGTSDATTTLTATASAIPEPPNFSASSGTMAGTVDLSWDAMGGITKLQYQYKKVDDAAYPSTGMGAWADIPDSADDGSSLADEVSYTVTGLDNGDNYEFQLRAHTASSMGPVATQTARAQTQSPPTGFSAATGTNPGEIDIEWTAPAGMSHTGFEYRHKRTVQDDSAYSEWIDVPDNPSAGDPDTDRDDETSYTVPSLWAGVGYTLQIRAESSNRPSQPGADQTATATAQVVAAPTMFTATIAESPGAIDLAWMALATAGLPDNDVVVNYQYRYKLNSATSFPTTGAGSWADMPTANTTSFRITGLNTYEAYDVDIRAAINDNDEDTATTAEYYSAAASATNRRSGLAAPDNLRATGGTNSGQVALTWNEQTTFGTGFTAAKYQYRTRIASPTATWPSGGGWTDVPSSTRTTASYTIPDLMNGRLHDIELRFVPSSSLTGGPSSVQGTPTVVAVPTSFSASTHSTVSGAIALTWTAQTLGTSSEAKYQYRRKLTSTGDANTGWPAASPYGWTDIGDGSDADSNAYNESALTLTGLTGGASYHVQLRFHWSDAVGASAAAATQTASASTVPVPGSFSASTGSAPGTVSLTWAAVVDASYQYRYKQTGADDSTYSSWASAGSGTTYTVTGLTNALHYRIELRAVVSGSTGPSTSAMAQAQSQPGPQNFAAAQGTNAGEIALTWAAPSTGTGNVNHFEYRYKRADQAAYPATWTEVTDGSDSGNSQADETSVTIASLWAGVSYNVQLRVDTTAGHSLPVLATETAQELAAPSPFSGTIGDNPGEIDLTWTGVTGLPSGDAVVQYQYRTKLPSASWPTTAPLGWVNIPAANTTSYTITGLASGTQYDVQLRAAVADGGEGTATTAEYHSDPATAASSIYSGLARPANLRATASTTVPGSIVLQWNQQSAFTVSTAKYEIRYKLQSTTNWPGTSPFGWADVPSSGHSTTGHTLTDLTNGAPYDIEVRFYHGSTLGSSAPTAVVGTASSIAVPTNLRAATSTSTAGAIDLTWNPQTAVTVSTAKFQVRSRLASATGPWTGVAWADVPDSTGTGGDADTDAHNEQKFTITGLSADQQYSIQLRLFMSTAIGASNAATASATASSVPIPTGLDATTGSGAGEIDVTWTAVIGATSYQYRYKLESVATYPSTGTGSWMTTSAATSQTIQNLSGGEWYNVQVKALVTGIGESRPTVAVRAQAQTTPGPATLTFAYGPNPGDIKIDWTRPAGNPLPPVTHYEYRYKLESAPDSAYPATWTKVPDADNDGDFDDEVTVTASGLQAGVSYHVQFRVYASQAVGYSLPQRGTQTARPVPPPTAFSADGGTNPGEVDLSWTAPAGVTILRYELRHRLSTTGAWSSWTSAGTATTHTYTTLLAGMSRTFELRAVMQTVGASAAVSTTGTPTPVPTPASFSATTGVFPGEVDISWMAVTGATSYEYRYRLSALSGDPWPAAEGWTSVPATMTSTTITLLNEGAAYQLEVRAAITNVGRSMAASASASARGATFMDQRPNAPAIHAAYAVDAAAIPGRIAIELPGSTDPFIYRYQTANPGQWSRWYKVTPQASDPQFLIPDLVPGVRYNIEVRAYTGMTTGFTTPLTATAQAAPLVAAEDFEASESSGVILLQWSSPALYTPDYYEYRTRPTGTQTWSDWVRVNHEGDRGSTQRRWVTGLESGISHDFELRMQTGAGPSPVANAAGSARLRIAEVHSIRPTVREVSIRAGDTIALTVDIYDTQKVLDNSIPGKAGSKLVFRWEDMRTGGGTGGGTFAAPTDERRVSYTAPSSPGEYIVTAEAQPDGVCTSHHEGAAEITDAERAQCTATFTIRVSGIPAVPAPRPDPVDPTGAIPTSMTDDKGGTYTVFTPTKGGTFTGTDITVTAPAGAIPDRTVVGIAATTSDIPTPDPIPGATMSLAGSYYDINAIADAGEPPIPSYTLNEPATACLPFPQEFRADLSNVVVVQRKSAGDLSILSTKIRSNAGDLTVCGTLTQLPATVAVARLGLVPAPAPTTPSTPADTPDTGATTPGYTLLLLITLLAGALVLTGMYRIRRMV